MFKRAHHQRIARVLAALDSDLLQQAQCYFAGGTAIVLLLDEYRESLDIGFLCASPLSTLKYVNQHSRFLMLSAGFANFPNFPNLSS